MSKNENVMGEKIKKKPTLEEAIERGERFYRERNEVLIERDALKKERDELLAWQKEAIAQLKTKYAAEVVP